VIINVTAQVNVRHPLGQVKLGDHLLCAIRQWMKIIAVAVTAIQLLLLLLHRIKLAVLK
jgi:hypothetical protein